MKEEGGSGRCGRAGRSRGRAVARGDVVARFSPYTGQKSPTLSRVGARACRGVPCAAVGCAGVGWNGIDEGGGWVRSLWSGRAVARSRGAMSWRVFLPMRGKSRRRSAGWAPARGDRAASAGATLLHRCCSASVGKPPAPGQGGSGRLRSGRAVARSRGAMSWRVFLPMRGKSRQRSAGSARAWRAVRGREVRRASAGTASMKEEGGSGRGGQAGRSRGRGGRCRDAQPGRRPRERGGPCAALGVPGVGWDGIDEGGGSGRCGQVGRSRGRAGRCRGVFFFLCGAKVANAQPGRRPRACGGPRAPAPPSFIDAVRRASGNHQRRGSAPRQAG